MPYLKSGRLRAIAVTGGKRSSQLPAVPTMAESGLKGYDITTWFGILTTGGTPPEIVNRLNGVIRTVVNEPNVRRFIADQGIEPLATTPEEFAGFLKSEIRKFAAIISAAGLKPE
jgi:tripartite-type tricarboxylate transporter receptor subunit TctC